MSDDVLDFTETDIKRGVILPSDWYKFDIMSYRKELAKAGDSTNYIFELVSKSSNEKFNSVPITQRFNSKAKGFMIPFIEACGATVAAGKKYDPNNCVSKTIEAFARVGEYNGNPKNELTQFRAAA